MPYALHTRALRRHAARAALPAGLVALLVLSACDKPPLTQVEAAEKAVEQARSAQAATYAAPALKRLEDSLSVAKAEVQRQEDRWFPSYDGAKASLTWVESHGGEVVEQARKVKEETRATTASLLAAAAKAVARSDSLVAVAPRGKGSQQDIELIEADVVELKALLGSAQQHLSAERFPEAQTSAKSIAAEAERLSGEVQAAIDKVEQARGRRRG